MAEAEDKILTENLFFLAGALSRKLSGEADEVFASVGLSSSHALLLVLIQDEPRIQPSALADKLYLEPSTITRLVQKLERRELVGRESEGRASYISCTDKGEEVAGDIKNRWRELLDQKREELGERYVEVLSEMISNALDAIES